MLAKRMNVQAARTPVATIAVIVQGIIQGCLQAALFSDVVHQEFHWRNKSQNVKATMNMLGLAF